MHPTQFPSTQPLSFIRLNPDMDDGALPGFPEEPPKQLPPVGKDYQMVFLAHGKISDKVRFLHFSSFGR
jgi:hypothetical protein